MMVLTKFSRLVLVFATAPLIIASRVGASEDFVLEATVDSVHAAMERGTLTITELVERYLERIEAYDQQDPELNSGRC